MMAVKEHIEINDIFELAFRFVTETNENVFLTGKAGTGKTTFLKYLKDHCTKNIVVAAPTGVAAINAGGVTLHSLFQLPFHPFLPTSVNKNELLQRLRFTSRRLQLLRKMDLLVIDEISMVRCDTLDAIDTILRHVRRKFNQPFGGVQVLFIGDLYQLPPVANRSDWMLLQAYYNTEFFFDSQVIREDIPVLIELQKIFRQKEDRFVSLLNKVRNNDLTVDDFDELHERYQPDFRPEKQDKYITLTSHNAQADRINTIRLDNLPGRPFTYHAEVKGDFPESMFPAESSLQLKQGAQVMFLKNDSEKRFFNGKIGVVTFLSNDEIIVDCDGEKIEVGPETWENTRYTINSSDGKLEQETLGSFSQFPLRLAWAITIHKSQGLTFEKVMIDAGSAFSSGQVYVALSRCTTLDGIVLLSRISSSAIHCNDAVVKCHQSLSPKGSLKERFDGARQLYTVQILEDVFMFNEIHESIDALIPKMELQAEKLNKEAMRWIMDFRKDFLACREVGQKFVSQILSLLQTEPVIEKNTALQQRIKDAARHFMPLMIRLKDLATHHPVVTEHREAATPIDEFLNQLLLSLLHQVYMLQYCHEDFTVAGFHQHKLRYAVPRISVSSYASKKKEAQFTDVPNPELYATLRRWRDMICEDHDLPIYMVANANSLKEIATYLPQDASEMMLIKGFGKAKVDRFGDDIVDMVKDYCSRYGIEPDTNISKKKKQSVSKKESAAKDTSARPPTHLVSYNLFLDGRSIEEIAKERKMAATTIEGHLTRYIAEGKIDIDTLVAPGHQKLIREAAGIHGWSSFKDLKDNLPEDISYGKIRMTKASLKEEQNES